MAVGLVLAGLWAVAAVSPIVLSLLSSFKENTQLISDPIGLPSPWRPENYTTAWFGPPLGQPAYRMALNSFTAATIGIAGGLAAGTMAAYGLARSTSRLMGLANRYFVLLITIPAVVTWIPLFNLADRLSALSNPVALGAAYAAMSVPMAVVLMRASFASFPLDVIEAAKIDGASELRIFAQIVAPMSRGTMIAVALVQGIQLWNELGLATVLLIDPESRTLPVGLTLYQGQEVANRAGQFASLMIMIIPIITAYFIFERKITDGMRLSAFK